MFNVNDFLDRAKAAAGVESDYALAVKVLGYKAQTTVSNWRNERSTPDERAIIKLCALTGDDPLDVAVRLQSMRAANDDAADLWRQVAEKLKGVGVVIMFPAVAMLLLALYPAAAEASPAFEAFDFASVCILCQMT